jgi:hypothetical protein
MESPLRKNDHGENCYAKSCGAQDSFVSNLLENSQKAKRTISLVIYNAQKILQRPGFACHR